MAESVPPTWRHVKNDTSRRHTKDGPRYGRKNTVALLCFANRFQFNNPRIQMPIAAKTAPKN
eukprot:1039760-Prorocentrum_minimum.AAC.2